jgi:hypothetical protein
MLRLSLMRNGRTNLHFRVCHPVAPAAQGRVACATQAALSPELSPLLTRCPDVVHVRFWGVGRRVQGGPRAKSSPPHAPVEADVRLYVAHPDCP